MYDTYAETRRDLSGCMAGRLLMTLTRWEAVCSTPAIPGIPRVTCTGLDHHCIVEPAVIGISYCHHSLRATTTTTAEQGDHAYIARTP